MRHWLSIGLVTGSIVAACGGESEPATKRDASTDSDVASVDGAPVGDGASAGDAFHDGSPGGGSTTFGTSLRFFGHGRDAVDRITIDLREANGEPSRPANIGATDFTIEFWLKAATDNDSTTCTEGGDAWINGNTVVDRDVWGDEPNGDFGVSLYGGEIAFGVARNGSSSQTLCSGVKVNDGAWHHAAVTRVATSGQMRIFVDGKLVRSGSGPGGDVRYLYQGTPANPYNPFLVLGAEKHDAGSSFPSFSGFVDELRLSTVARYTADFARPNVPFSVDANTAALYHFDEATSAQNQIVDAVGRSPGLRRVGGDPTGPIWSTDAPTGP